MDWGNSYGPKPKEFAGYTKGEDFTSPQTGSIYEVASTPQEGRMLVASRELGDERHRVTLRAERESLVAALDGGLREKGWSFGATSSTQEKIQHISVVAHSDSVGDAITDAEEAVA